MTKKFAKSSKLSVRAADLVKSNKSAQPTAQVVQSRTGIIVKSGYLFIATNFFLGVFNITIGLLAGSLAITSDAIHSFIDSISGFLIIISEKLSNHQKLSVYRNRIERITTIMIAVIIIVAGIDIIAESIEKILEPEAPDYTAPTIIVLLASVALKYLLAAYLKHTGRTVKSTVLTASGVETMNDAWISVAVLFSAVFYLIVHVDIEAYISLVIALLIIKVGLEFIFPHLSRHHHHHLESDPDHDHCGRHN
ncbi:cation diffusion facilitator family transporter [Candidatus Saccharibacteria bacterium]|nr:cation diffusion facilitator family transporter [Candidatus Saccharibacteria bacterium]